MADLTFGYGEAEYGGYPYGRFVGLDGSGISVTRTYTQNGQNWFETEWQQLNRVTDDQHELALLTYVNENVASGDIALIYVEHTPSLTNKQITRSSPLNINTGEDVLAVTDVPVQKDDYYRIQLTKYTAENIFDNINIGLIHK